jgi:DNA topoisomerase-2
VRKQHIIASLEKELVLLSNKARYINELLEGTIDLRKKKKEEVVAMLEAKGFSRIDDEDAKKDYKYLIKMPMDSVTEEMVEKLNREHDAKQAELVRTKDTTVGQMWTRELDELQAEYLKHKEERAMMLSNVEVKVAEKKKKPKLKVVSAATASAK